MQREEAVLEQTRVVDLEDRWVEALPPQLLGGESCQLKKKRFQYLEGVEGVHVVE